MKWLFMIGVVMGVVLTSYCAFLVFDQHRMITTAQPVEATVIATEVQKRPSQYIDSYEPIVTFKYEVNGQPYTSSLTTPTEEEHAGEWANRVVAKFKIGETYPAWYPENEPERAFLLKRYSSFPYLGVLVGIMMGLGSAALLPQAIRRGAKVFAPSDQGDGWFELRAPQQLHGAIRLYIGGGILWQVLGALVWGHYLVVGEPPHGGFFWGAMGAYVVIGSLILGVGIWAWWVGRFVDDARMFINLPTPVTGDALQVLVQQQTLRNVHVKDLVVTLICKQTTVKVLAQNPIEEQKIVNTERHTLTNTDIPAGEWISETINFLIPPFAPPSSSKGDRGKVRNEWSIAMKLSLRGAPPYPDNFAIQVGQGERKPVTADTTSPSDVS